MPKGIYKRKRENFIGNKNPFFGKHHTRETKTKLKNREFTWGKKISEKLKGKNLPTSFKNGKLHPNWKGGISKLRDIIYNSFKTKKWRSDIFQRDNWICQTCGRKSKEGNPVYLETHHIKQFSKIIQEYKIKTLQEAINCAELWNINNGITLCKECHNLTKKGNQKRKVKPLGLL